MLLFFWSLRDTGLPHVREREREREREKEKKKKNSLKKGIFFGQVGLESDLPVG